MSWHDNIKRAGRIISDPVAHKTAADLTFKFVLVDFAQVDHSHEHGAPVAISHIVQMVALMKDVPQLVQLGVGQLAVHHADTQFLDFLFCRFVLPVSDFIGGVTYGPHLVGVDGILEFKLFFIGEAHEFQVGIRQCMEPGQITISAQVHDNHGSLKRQVDGYGLGQLTGALMQ